MQAMRETQFSDDCFHKIRIPTLPNTVHHLLSTLTDDNLNYRQLAAIIDRHPDIAVRLLSLANSA